MAEKRVAIAGVPRAGKTTMAGPGARSTDSVMGLGWSESSEVVAGWLDEPGALTVEGMTPGQASMGKGAETVLEAIRSDLERRGVRIRRV